MQIEAGADISISQVYYRSTPRQLLGLSKKLQVVAGLYSSLLDLLSVLSVGLGWDRKDSTENQSTNQLIMPGTGSIFCGPS